MGCMRAIVIAVSSLALPGSGVSANSADRIGVRFNGEIAGTPRIAGCISASMAETVHLVLKANGNVIQGESTQRDLGRDKTIECLVFRDNVRTAREMGTLYGFWRRVN